jgi:hypothetical protein
MGSRQSSTANWSVDDWAYGTGENAVPVEEVVAEVRLIPARYFGGKAIGNDESMHQMQRDLLAFDDTLKRIFFRRKKKKQPQTDVPPEEYYYEDEQYYPDEQAIPEEEPNHSIENPNHLSPIYAISTAPSSAPPSIDRSNDATTNNTKLFWRCSHCTAENKVSDNACRRCGQAETKF